MEISRQVYWVGLIAWLGVFSVVTFAALSILSKKFWFGPERSVTINANDQSILDRIDEIQPVI